jgi:hypothetical protein
MRDHQIPLLTQDFKHIALIMKFRPIISGLQITGPSIMAQPPELFTANAG